MTGPGSPTGDTFTEQRVVLGGGAGTVIGCGLPGQPECPPTNGVPEPSTLLLLGGAASLAGLVRRVRAYRRRS